MTARQTLALLPLALIVAGCSDAEEPAAMADPSKLSAELEERAQEIEKRADIAVREAESLAQEELDQLRAETAEAAEPDAADGADTPDADAEN